MRKSPKKPKSPPQATNPWKSDTPLGLDDEVMSRVLASLEKGDLNIFEGLNASQRSFVINLFKKIEEGDTSTLEALYSVDYERIPVDPAVFFTESDYLGHIGRDIYTAWWGHLMKILDPASGIFEVILTGPIGNGKCSRWDTLIPTSKGILTAQEVFQSKPLALESETGTRRLDKRFDEGEINTVRMVTRRGHEFEGSPHHRVRVLEGFDRKWKKLADLRHGDIVLLHPKGIEGKNTSLAAAELTGWFIAEGTITGNGAVLNLHEDEMPYVEALARRAKEHLPYHRVKVGKNGTTLHLTGGKAVKGVLSELWGSGTSHYKVIPRCIREGDENVICAFLRGLFSGDGDSGKTSSPTLTTMSRQLAQQTAVLLTYLGIYSSIHEKEAMCKGVKYGTAFNVVIVGTDSQARFAEKIGFYQEYKHRNLLRRLYANRNTDHFYALPMTEDSARKLKSMQPTEGGGRYKVSKYGDKKHSPKGLLDRVVRGQRVTLRLLKEVLQAGGKLPPELFKLTIGATMFDVVDYTKKGRAKCYDFTVAGDPSYITNGFVSHNTLVSMAMLAYKLYSLSCFKDPARYFGLAKKSRIVFGVYSLTLENAEDVGFYKLRDQCLDDSPYFRDMFPRKPYGVDYIEFPQKQLKVITGSGALHAIGKDLFAIMIDEINFMAKGKATAGKAHELATAVSRRLESRFMSGMTTLDVPGICLFVSSKKAETDYLEQRIKRVRGLPGVHVVDGPIWQFNEKIEYCGKHFRVRLGDAIHDPLVLDEVAYDEKGVTVKPSISQYEEARMEGRMIEVPVEHYKSFVEDINGAIRDVAGIATSSIINFFPRKRVLQDMFEEGSKLPRFFPSEVLRMPIRSPLRLTELFDVNKACAVQFSQRLPIRHARAPRYIHVDLARNTDAAGIVMVHPSEFSYQAKKETQGVPEETVDKNIEVDFVLRVTTDDTGEDIDFERIVQFIGWLKQNGFWIRRVTYDSWQSAHSIQQLKLLGINAGVRSVDKTIVPYNVLQRALGERRVACPYHAILNRELGELEYSAERDKVDHPKLSASGEPGSKDCADALAASVYECVVDKLTPDDEREAGAVEQYDARYEAYLEDIKEFTK